MTEPNEHEAEEPTVTDVPEPDQEPHEPVPDEVEEEAESEPDTGVEDEESPEGGDPTDPSVAPVGARDEREVEIAAKKLRKHAETNANRIGAIMGEDAQHLEVCPRCMGGDPDIPKTPGFIWPANIVPLLPEHKASVKLSIGEGAEPEYEQAQDAGRCGQCKGLGKVDTGSLVPTERYLRCLNCQGRGWIGSRAEASLPVAPNGQVDLVEAVVGGGEPTPSSDPWGRLPGDPQFGVLPGYER